MDGEVAINFTQLILSLFGVMCTVLAYFLKGAMDKLEEHDHILNALHERYVKKDDFKEFKLELWEKLDELKKQLRDK